MRRSAVPVMLGVLVVALAALLGWAVLRPKGEDAAGRTLDAQIEAGNPVAAPGADRVLASLNGPTRARLRDLRGQVVVLNFWAQWCIPCQDEAPMLERTHRALQRSKQGTVLGVVFQSSPAKAREFEQKNGMTYPSYLDPGSKLAQGDYGVSGMPETFIIDRAGRIRAISRQEIGANFLAGNLRRAGVTGPALRAPLADAGATR